MTPGRTLHRFARALLPRDVCEQIIDAQLADFQHEWSRAQDQPRVLILASGYYGFWRAVFSCALRNVKSDSGDRHSLNRILAVWFGITILATAWWAISHVLSMGTPLSDGSKQFAGLHRLQVRVLNTWITGMLPIAAAFGAAVGLATLPAETARRMRFPVLLLAIAASIGLALAVGWILPLSNYAVNVAMGGCCSKWPMENTLGELKQQRDLVPSYYITIAVPWAPLVMAVFGLSIANIRWGGRVALTVGVCWLYRLLVFPAEWPILHGAMPVAMEAWVANLTVALLAAVSLVLDRERPGRKAVRTA